MSQMIRTWTKGLAVKPLEAVIFGLSIYINNTNKVLIDDVPGDYEMSDTSYPIAWQQLRGGHPDADKMLILHNEEFIYFDDGRLVPTTKGDTSKDGFMMTEIRAFFNDTAGDLVFNTGNWTRL